MWLNSLSVIFPSGALPFPNEACLGLSSVISTSMSYIKWQHCYPGYLLGACLAQLDRVNMFASFLDLGYCKAVCYLKICHEMYIHFDNIWVLSHASSSALELLHFLPCPILHMDTRRVWTWDACEKLPPPPSPPKKNTTSNVLQIVLMQKNGIFSTIQDGTYTPMNSGM
jgi:hypothetical protein